MALGERLKKARNNKGLTQIEAAKKLGVTNGALSGYERNYRDPDTSMLKNMADLYDVSIDYLVGKENSPSNTSLMSKEERDIAKQIIEFTRNIENSDALAFDGEPMSEEAKQSLIESMEHIFRQTQRINKKYIPKKYRDDQ